MSLDELSSSHQNSAYAPSTWPRKPFIPPSDTSSSSSLFTPPFTPGSSSSHSHQHNPTLLPDPQTQLHNIAQAWQHLSDLMSAAGLPSYPLPPPICPPLYDTPAQTKPPVTPNPYHHYPSSRHKSSQTPSLAAGPSSAIPDKFETPISHYSYPSFDQVFSPGMLPPSSPFSSSEHSPPALYSRRTRSKSRSRQDKSQTDDRQPTTSKPRGRARSVSARDVPSSPVARGRDAMWDPEDLRVTSVDDGVQDRRVERGRTPGPPSLTERSSGSNATEKKGTKATRKGKERG